ncbi:proline dehydrogenase family protein [Leucobacter sp. UT-8R-CII-1-4]|uniref:proline dehydrogenase family protein n=1 Tax=Leucobacter sp. UT-8R-CII-1-4 TaxID=3040075 RepID=UPI0024A8F7B1|nr:proline dehydrogenase family protein [Leucobacter sp. UT-8R-CII-1-4]MDI6023695.1 proline dehydrogenase family protein [Leucobacter sp. UT-8R-CII-1-4]
MTIPHEELAAAADTLRSWALDERLKETVRADPALASIAERVARRYTAGSQVDDALRLLAANHAKGHQGSIECVGESVRDADVALRETETIVDLAAQLAATPGTATISFDLSHVGSVVSPELGLKHALRIAQAARDAGSYVMVSAEGSSRTDLVLELWERISSDFPETGITLQARLHRTPIDLDRVRRRPGPIRVVKGAFLESSAVAHPRNSAPMYQAYRAMVSELVRASHRVNIASHDRTLVARLQDELGDELRAEHVEFEMLQGLGTELLDSLRDEGLATREYIVFGPEWWLYVLNRIAEHPERAITALADLNPQFTSQLRECDAKSGQSS